MIASAVSPEFSRPIAVEQLHDRDNSFAIEANDAERAALARRFGIVAVDTLTATVQLKPLGNGMVRLAGRVDAQVRQACVVTLVEVPARIDDSFERFFAPITEDEDEDEEEIEIEFDGKDPPDPLVDGTIDIGEVAAEQLALALDPYPRAPGAAFTPPAAKEDEPAPPSPFAALAALKKKQK